MKSFGQVQQALIEIAFFRVVAAPVEIGLERLVRLVKAHGSPLVPLPVEVYFMGIEFVSLTEGVDTSTPTGRMIFTVLGAVAELNAL